MTDSGIATPKSTIMFGLSLTEMARRRGKQSGHLAKEGPSWIGYWQEEVRGLDGAKKWHKFSKKICGIVEPDPVTKKMRTVTEKQARTLFDEIVLSKLEITTTNPQSLATVREFVERKFEPTLVLKKRKGQEHYRGMLKNHVLPAIGHLRLRDVRQDEIQDLILAKVAKGYSAQTAVHIRNTISAIFNKAKQVGWYSGDIPTAGVEMPELVHKKRIALTAEQLRRLLQSLRVDHFAMVLTYALLGLRRGELSGLTWRYLNLTGAPVTVDGESIPAFTAAIRQNYVWVFGKHLAPEQRGGQYQSLKSKSGPRNIPMPMSLVLALGEVYAGSNFQGPDDPVFVSRTGKPVDAHNVAEDYLKPACIALGLPVISWHDLRHTNSTLAELAGATTTNRMRVLGHATDRMTQHYSHEDMAQARVALESVAESLGRGGAVQQVKGKVN